ncbi:hypothetical protein F4777DRAFT_239452 [Nemania sp. FL0916]|nr:hypothetical protein F4777DRAFT_239452 [Nemania sp. FL0916]
MSQPVQYSVDKFRPGYPRYAALLASHPTFHNFRRFSRVRMRLLLAAQDRVAALEQRLDQLDEQEDRQLFLGCMRRDSNVERQQVLSDLKGALAEYDGMLDKCRGIAYLPSSRQRDVQNLKNWVDGTACLDRHESSYLDHKDDLVNTAEYLEKSTAYTESLVEECVILLEKFIPKVLPRLSDIRLSTYRITSDDHVLLLGPALQNFSRFLVVIAATLVLMGPTIVLFNITGSSGRVVTSVFSGVVFLMVLSFFTRAKTSEMLVAGASYAAVLVAFTAMNVANTGVGA